MIHCSRNFNLYSNFIIIIFLGQYLTHMSTAPGSFKPYSKAYNILKIFLIFWMTACANWSDNFFIIWKRNCNNIRNWIGIFAINADVINPS